MEDKQHEASAAKTTKVAIGLIMLGLLAWGAVHALGAYGHNQNPWRAVVVMGFSLAFVGFWVALLAWRARQKG